LGFGLFNVPNNRSLFLSAPAERSGAAGGMQGTARLVGQTAGAVTMTLLFALTPAEAAPRIGLGIGSALTLLAGLVSVFPSGCAQNAGCGDPAYNLEGHRAGCGDRAGT
jgi:DHA2 family multidrug resistance protein-like MFS transporter